MSFNNSQAIHTKVCSLNSFALLGGVVGLATSLASAANDCAVTTSIPNVNAMCSAAITGLITGIAGVGGSAILINAACKPKGWYHNVNQSTRPSDVGSNWRYEKHLDGERRLRGVEEMPVETESAPPRKLLFGGGIESTHAHCALESASTMWSLASAALAINAASHKDDKDCPPKNIITKSTKSPKGYGIAQLPYRIPQALCAVDVFSALVGFLGAISFMQLIAVQCTNILNLEAICGTGVTGMTTAMAGLGQAITGLWLACDLAQLPVIHPALMGVRGVDVISGGMLSDAIAGDANAPNLAYTGEFARRRLEEQKDHAKVAMKVVDNLKEEVMKHFKTPEDVFMHLGYNFSDSNAEWRKGPDDQLDLSHLSSLVQDTTEKAKASGLFGSSATCKE